MFRVYHTGETDMAYEEIEVRRDCQAVQIPQGNTVIITTGTPVIVTQSLGGSYTVQVPSLGGLFRVAGHDADALGLQATSAAEATTDAAGPVSDERVWSVLRHVYDPEIPVNIVDLGLVYDMRIEPLPAGQSRVEVRMTLTAPGCGMGQTIAMDARQRIESLPGVAEADVQLVWDPPWNPHMISAEGRAKLGMEE
jgi:probable FeS assembly SUF system protein SufT